MMVLPQISAAQQRRKDSDWAAQFPVSRAPQLGFRKDTSNRKSKLEGEEKLVLAGLAVLVAAFMSGA